LKAKFQAIFKRKGEKKSKTTEATPAAAAAEPTKTETVPAPAGESDWRRFAPLRQ
jgi:hypothetical protein